MPAETGALVEGGEVSPLERVVLVADWLDSAFGTSGHHLGIDETELNVLETTKSWALELNYMLMKNLAENRGDFKGFSWVPSGEGGRDLIDDANEQFVRRLINKSAGKKLSLGIKEEDAHKEMPIVGDENSFGPTAKLEGSSICCNEQRRCASISC